MKYILEYKEFDNLTIEEQEIKDKAISDNTFMKAPNGRKTKLTEKQWLQVRTKNFINWFGDWLNDPDKASKVIDENGEPIVVYHGSQNPNIKFESNRPAYFTSDKETAESFADRSFMGEPLYDDEVPTIYDVYLFIDKPFIITTEYEYEKYFQDSYINVDNIKNGGFNGMIYDPEDGGDIYYVVFSSNQIKSATNNSGSFDINNNSILESSDATHSDYLRWKRKNVTLRGITEVGEENNGGAMLGDGLYSAYLSNRELARKYGKVYYLVNAKPKNPKKFNTLNECEVWLYNMYINTLEKNNIEYDRLSANDTFFKFTNIKDEMLKLGYDGIDIKGREYVNFKPTDVLYFKTEEQLKNYFYSNI